MPPRLISRYPWFLRYAAALVAVDAGWLLRQVLTTQVGPGLPTYVTFYPAVMIVALLAGLGPGLVATAASALLVDYWLLSPHGGLGFTSTADAVGLALFSGTGVFFSVVSHLYRRAREKAAGRDAEVERRESQGRLAEPAGQALLLNAGLVVSLAILALAGWQCLRYMGAENEVDRLSNHAYAALEESEKLFSALKDAETGQRGYLLTGDEKYLQPYKEALSSVETRLEAMKRLGLDDPGQRQRVAVLQPLVQNKLAEMRETVELRRTNNLQAALQLVATGKGKLLMDEIRQRLGEAQEQEEGLLHAQAVAKVADSRKTLQALLAGGIFGFLVLAAVFLFLKRENAGRRRAEAALLQHRDQLQEAVAVRTTELSQANESLRQSEERVTFALETSHTGAWEMDLGDHSAHRSLEHDRIFGHAELLPRWTYEMFLDHVLPEDRPTVDSKFRRAVETGGDWSFECRIRRPDQQVRWIWAAGRHRTDTSGIRRRMAGIVQDITERKQAEAALRESEQQFRTLADSMANLAWWANSDGYITWYNRRWYEYTGTTPEQMEGWGWQSVHDPQVLPAVLARWKQSIATGEPFEMTFPLRGADGVFRPFLTRGIPLKDAQGRVQQWFGTNTDVLGQKQAEEALGRLAAIVESSDDAIIAKSVDGTITSWNVGAERLFGYAAEEVIGRSIRLLLPPERSEEEDQIMARLQAGERVEHFETVRLTRNGRSVAVSLTSSPLKDAGGQIIGASKIVRDITARKQAEEAVRQLNAELSQRVGQLEAANEAVRASRKAALNLMDDAVQARKHEEQANAELRNRSEQLQHLNRTLTALKDSSLAMMRASSEADYLTEVCKVIIEDCGHAMVWVGLAENDEAKTVRPVAHAGFEEGYLETLRVTWDDSERGRGPTGTAIRTGIPCACKNMLTDPRFAPWRPDALKRSYASSLVVPLIADAKPFGAITIYSKFPDPFSEDEVKLLMQLADDVSYCVGALRLRTAKDQADQARERAQAALQEANEELEQRVADRTSELQDSEARYRSLVTAASQIVWITDASGQVTTEMPTWQAFTGQTFEQYRDSGWAEALHPQDRQRTQEVWLRSVASCSRYEIEYLIRRHDGEYRQVIARGVPVLAKDGTIREWVGTCTDITERKQAERRREFTSALLALFAQKSAAPEYLRSVLEVVSQWSGCQALGIRIADEHGEIPYQAWSGFEPEFIELENKLSLQRDNCCCIRAISRASEKPDRSLLTPGGSYRCDDSIAFVNQLPPAERARYRGNCMKFGFASLAIIPIRYRDEVIGAIHLADRRPNQFPLAAVEFLETMTPLMGEALHRFQVEAELARHRDQLEVLVRQRTQELTATNVRLEETAADLERSNRDLEQFAYVASHDLQEPLRAVGGYIKLVERRLSTTLDERAREFIAGAFEGALRMERLISDLLAFSRVGTRGGVFVATDLDAALRQALANLEVTIKSAPATITHDPLPTLTVDATQIMQLFQNLIGNALKFRVKEPPSIHIGARQQEGRWVFSVRDNGIGIDPQYFDKIFQIFQRLHTRKEYSGTGIGLAICKKIVERHGGSIWVESQPGEGLTFFFSFPGAEG